MAKCPNCKRKVKIVRDKKERNDLKMLGKARSSTKKVGVGARIVRATKACGMGGERAMEKALTRGWNLPAAGQAQTISKGIQRKRVNRKNDLITGIRPLSMKPDNK